jgi:hypothetical protein
VSAAPLIVALKTKAPFLFTEKLLAEHAECEPEPAQET